MKEANKLRAKLRVCARCEWIFHVSEAAACPKCEFAHYSARYVFGNKAYRYAVTQQPWFDRKMNEYASELYGEIETARLRVFVPRSVEIDFFVKARRKVARNV